MGHLGGVFVRDYKNCYAALQLCGVQGRTGQQVQCAVAHHTADTLVATALKSIHYLYVVKCSLLAPLLATITGL